MKKLFFILACLCAYNFSHNIAYSMGSNDTGDVERGEMLFRPCSQCHVFDGMVDEQILRMNGKEFEEFAEKFRTTYDFDNINQYFMHFTIDQYTKDEIADVAAYMQELHEEYILTNPPYPKN